MHYCMNLCRFMEIVSHNGEALKHLMSEKLGEGVMSAVDLQVKLDTVKGPKGEDRVTITLDGKFLPFGEQLASD